MRPRHYRLLAVALLVITVATSGHKASGRNKAPLPANSTPSTAASSTSPGLPPLPDPGDVCSAMDDKSFKNYCLRKFDRNRDGKLSPAEADAVTEINVRSMGMPAQFKGIEIRGIPLHSLKGIEYFPNLQKLDCYFNQLTELDVSRNKALTTLFCNSNRLTHLDLGKNRALTTLRCNSNRLTALDVSGNTALTGLYCSDNNLTHLDVGENTALTSLHCDGNRLTDLDVSANTALMQLYCDDNKLTSLDVSKNSALITLYCYNNRLTALDVGGAGAMMYLHCYDNQLTNLDISGNGALVELACGNNKLTTLDVGNNGGMGLLNCCDNRLTDTALNAFFEVLHTPAFPGIIFMAGNPGTSGCSQGIATAKGWAVNVERHPPFP